MSPRRHTRGYNGRRGKPRPRRLKVQLPAPAPVIEPANQRTKLGPVTAHEHESAAAMVDEVAAKHAQLDREGDRAWETAQRYTDEPMIEGSVTWHPHQVDGRQR